MPALRTGVPAVAAVLVGWAATAGALPAAPGGSGPRLHAEGPPPAHTGGFGEPTCQACHTEYEVNAPGGALTVEGLPAAWEPGTTYLVSVVLRSEEMGAAGFQLSSRGLDGRPAGRFEPVDGRTAVDSVGGDTLPPAVYARHTRAGSEVDDPARATWLLSWTAPEVATEVVFHGAANSGNGDDSPFGDLIYTVNFSAGAADTSR